MPRPKYLAAGKVKIKVKAMTKKRTNWDKYLVEQLKDPEIKHGFEEARKRIDLAYEIRNARRRIGMTQKELASKAGIKPNALARLESSNYRGHTVRTLEKIAEALNMKLEIHFAMP